MNKKKILKISLFIVIVLIVIFLAFTIRKMIILKTLNQKVAKFVSSDSYYEKIINDSGKTETIVEYYCKGDNAVLFLNTTDKDTGETRKLTNYYKDEKTTYIEADENKIALLDSNGLPSRIMIRQVDTGNNVWDLFLISLATSIKSEEYEGKECYVLSLGETSKVYVEKETGLALKANEGIVVDENGNETVQEVEYYYDFNSLEDSIFEEPDINEYKIQENNN